jgi:cation/acetate symporter
MTAAFAGDLDRLAAGRSAQAAKERAAFPAQLIRSETGVGSSSASGH